MDRFAPETLSKCVRSVALKASWSSGRDPGGVADHQPRQQRTRIRVQTVRRLPQPGPQASRRALAPRRGPGDPWLPRTVHPQDRGEAFTVVCGRREPAVEPQPGGRQQLLPVRPPVARRDHEEDRGTNPGARPVRRPHLHDLGVDQEKDRGTVVAAYRRAGRPGIRGHPYLGVDPCVLPGQPGYGPAPHIGPVQSGHGRARRRAEQHGSPATSTRDRPAALPP